MRHRNKRFKLNRDSDHRKALLRNLAISLFQNGEIKTTQAKAKVLRSLVDRLINVSKKGDLASRRYLLAKIPHKPTVNKLIHEWASKFQNKKSGFCKIFKLGWRQGDKADMALVRLAS